MSYLREMDDPPVPKLPAVPSSTSESADHGRGAYFTGRNGRAMVRFQTERDIALTVANEFGMSGFLVVDAEDWFTQMRRLCSLFNAPDTARPSTYVAGAAPLVPRTVTLSLTAEDWDEVSRISWKRLMNDEILLSLMIASRLAGDREQGGNRGNAEGS